MAGQLVQTVLGPVAAHELGFTLSHEHVVFGWFGWELFHGRPSRETSIEESLRMARAAREAGVRTVLECTAADMSRDVDVMRVVSETSGIHIVCCTGLYGCRPVPYFIEPSYPAEAIGAEFVKEISKGIDGTPVRAGFIKTAVSSDQLTSYERKVLQAAAIAHRATGAPIVMHTDPNCMGLGGLEWLRELDVAGSRIVIAHADTPDLKLQLHIIDHYGAYLSFDHFGLAHYQRDEVSVANIGALCALGRAHRVMMSSDCPCSVCGAARDTWLKLLKDTPEWSWSDVPRRIVPWLRKNGVTDAAIHQMTVLNAPEWLTGQAVAPPG